MQVSLPFKPYFYVACKPETEREVAAFLQKRFAGKAVIEVFSKEDLDLVWSHFWCNNAMFQ